MSIFFHADSGFVAGGIGELEDISTRGRVLFTADGGQTWRIVSTTQPNGHWCWKITFPTRTTGYISLETTNRSRPSYFLKTTDGGQIWQEKPYAGNNREQGMGFVDENRGWASGGLATYETIDGGETWNSIGLNSRMNRFRFLSDSLGYACGSTVYKYSNGAVTSVPETVEPIPETFRLEQNHPNPFNPSTSITYVLQESAFVILQVYDLLGKEIATLVEDYRLEGTYSVTFDAGTLASGVYVYKMQAGDFVDMKKMLLVR